MLTRQDLDAPSIQNKNAGNSGDLVKHLCYLTLIRELAKLEPQLGVVEAHGGKAVYVSTSPHLRKARRMPGYADSILGRSQKACFAEPPRGLGQVAGLQHDEIPYAGSGAIHARAVADHQLSSLLSLDKDDGIRNVAKRVCSEPCFDEVRSRITIEDPQGLSEQFVERGLTNGAFAPHHVVHLDPFAFTMSPGDDPTRLAYRKLVTSFDQEVRNKRLMAASIFFTWGRNNAAALQDLSQKGGGYLEGLVGGFKDLQSLVSDDQSIRVVWCWELYFAMLLIVPAHLTDRIARSIQSELDWLRDCLSVCDVVIAPRTETRSIGSTKAAYSDR